MMRIVVIAIILMLSSCAAQKEVKRANRSAKALQKLTIKYPELLQQKTISLPISLITPGHTAVIQRPTRVDEPKSAMTIPAFPWFFEDQHLIARIDLNDNEQILDYTIKPAPLDTTVNVPCPTIQPTVYKPMPLTGFQIFLMYAGGISCIFVIFFILHACFRKLR